ncbi:M23 family metallopeptidase [Paenibacillus sp. Soil522]|uniref:M23 family metallopeptidase n=1 Tax=Paenibacillus sp. Soil522 TaxID=1736388 RepID=UPI000700F81A|nr:M23 family metallopeptidase [Paenibacillus sp. Soil522]KRE45502.1 hypothetical protein ASG81_12880 [Paenibacillus sp. Soil522]
MPTWIVALIPKDKLAKVLIYAIIFLLAAFLLLFTAPLLIFLHIPLADAEQGHMTYYKSAAGRVQTDFGISVSWQEVMAIDAVLLGQDFSKSSASGAYRSAKYFVREEKKWVEKTCTKTVTETDKKGKPITREEEYDCSYEQTVYYERSLHEVIGLLIEKGLLTETQQEDVLRYTVLDWASVMDDGQTGPIGPIPPGEFLWPVPGIYRLTSTFGLRVHPVTGEHSFHDGIDIGAPKGHDVLAAKSGVVTLAEEDWGTAGNTIIIQHGSEETRYYHLSAFDVTAGMYVPAGEKIGEVGSTGRSTGPHLHFEVRINGEPVNPMMFY